MGDSGALYVSPSVVCIYKSMLRLATVITPNWFEVEWVPDDLPPQAITHSSPSPQDLDKR
jgi:pyridoxal/pyridoxine/pyridoxamine kinase